MNEYGTFWDQTVCVIDCLSYMVQTYMLYCIHLYMLYMSCTDTHVIDVLCNIRIHCCAGVVKRNTCFKCVVQTYMLQMSCKYRLIHVIWSRQIRVINAVYSTDLYVFYTCCIVKTYTCYICVVSHTLIHVVDVLYNRDTCCRCLVQSITTIISGLVLSAVQLDGRLASCSIFFSTLCIL